MNHQSIHGFMLFLQNWKYIQRKINYPMFGLIQEVYAYMKMNMTWLLIY